MIYFVRSRPGYEQLAASSAWPPTALWVAPGVLTRSELAELRATGIDLTDFTRPIDPEHPSAIAAAIETIREHHPGQVVWVDGSVVS